MARKLRIFPGAEHGLEGKGLQLVASELPPRRVRVRGEVMQLDGGFVPFNQEAYNRRFGHGTQQ